MLCLNCHLHPAVIDASFGVLPCRSCQAQPHVSAGEQVEYIPERIHEDRKAQRNDIEQPHRQGKLNKRWVDLYGVKKARERGFSQKEIDAAEYVYSTDDTYYSGE